jgi:uncharacterized protein YcbX
MEPCKVEELWRFPVKSMGGERPDHLEFDADGVVGDRRFAVRDLETGLIASAKRPGRWGVLLSCRATTDADGDVSVALPDGSTLKAGDAALDDILSELTGRRVTLEHIDAVGADTSLDFEVEYPELEHVRLRGRFPFPAAAFTDARSYVDGAAVHLITTSTMATIASASGAVDVTAVRFRPIRAVPERSVARSRVASMRYSVVSPSTRNVVGCKAQEWRPCAAHRDAGIPSCDNQACVSSLSPKSAVARELVPSLT